MSVADAAFTVPEPASYQGAPYPPFAKPEETACFSRGADRKVRFDRSQLHKFRVPQLPCTLDEGFATYVPKDISGELAPLGDVLGALTYRNVQLQPDQIVTYRNNLNKLFLTPYVRKDDWEMGVSRRADGTVHLHVRQTARQRAEERDRDERQQHMCYWGYRFEQLCTRSKEQAAALAGSGGGGGGGGGGAAAEGTYRVPSPSDAGSYDELYSPADLEVLRRIYPPKEGQEAVVGSTGAAAGAAGAANPIGPVDANEEFCSVVKLKLGSTRLLMAAEVDCEAAGGGEGGVRHAGYLELKTSKLPGSERELATFERHKLLKFWSYLAGVKTVLVGYRDDAGTVRKLEALDTMTLHRGPRSKGYWDPAVCLNFGNAALEWLLATLRAGASEAEYVLRYEPAQGKLLLRAADAEEAATTAATPTDGEAGAQAAKRARVN